MIIFMRMKKMNKMQNNEYSFAKRNDEIKNILQVAIDDTASLAPHLKNIEQVLDQNQLVRARTIAVLDKKFRERFDSLIGYLPLDEFTKNNLEMRKLINNMQKDE